MNLELFIYLKPISTFWLGSSFGALPCLPLWTLTVFIPASLDASVASVWTQQLQKSSTIRSPPSLRPQWDNLKVMPRPVLTAWSCFLLLSVFILTALLCPL